ncbi:MAG TPA: hypothetical protein DCM54_02710 [Gammaproteobacteria bacterium]|nr:hypothetical protein [Gammaproteobacteria bacterium]
MQLGDAFRLDRIFGMRMQKGMSDGKLHSDYGASEPFTYAERSKYYAQPGFQALHGFGVAVLNLTDSGGDKGGLRLIPGSHNSHFRMPDRVRQAQNSDIVICPEAPAVSIVFSARRRPTRLQPGPRIMNDGHCSINTVHPSLPAPERELLRPRGLTLPLDNNCYWKNRPGRSGSFRPCLIRGHERPNE